MAVLSTVRKYIPKFGDNREQDDDEQIRVFLKNSNVKDRQTHLRKFIKMDPKDITVKMMEDDKAAEIQKILNTNVVRIENLTFEEVITKEDDPRGNVGDTITRPATVDDLIVQGEWMLCLELFMEILNGSQLSREKEKNSESQSGSSLPEEEEVTAH